MNKVFVLVVIVAAALLLGYYFADRQTPSSPESASATAPEVHGDSTLLRQDEPPRLQFTEQYVNSGQFVAKSEMSESSADTARDPLQRQMQERLGLGEPTDTEIQQRLDDHLRGESSSGEG